jgi:hypothetical protein
MMRYGIPAYRLPRVGVGKEIARLEGRPLEAMDLYERALGSAKANGFVHDEALAYELAARFYAARGFEEVAHLYLENARRGYLRWGADGKVRQLDQLHTRPRQDERSRRLGISERKKSSMKMSVSQNTCPL